MGENGESVTKSSIHTKSHLGQKEKNDDSSVLLKKAIYKKREKKLKKKKEEKRYIYIYHIKKKEERRSRKTSAPLLYLCCLPPRLMFIHNRCVCGLVFTPKLGRITRELEGFQDCVNQGIDCMRIDISWFRCDTRIDSLWMTSADNDDELQLASGNYISDSTKGERLGSKLS